MTAANPTDDREWEIGDRVEITAGRYIGDEGELVEYLEASDLLKVKLDNQVSIWVFEGMFEVIEEAESSLPYPMPGTPVHGMTSEQLADYVSDFIVASTTRVTGVGDEQYSEGTHQKFEAMSVDELFEWAEEEVQDIAVYAAMLHIRIRRVREALKPIL